MIERGDGTLTTLDGLKELRVLYELNIPGVSAFADGSFSSTDETPLPILDANVPHLLHLEDGRWKSNSGNSAVDTPNPSSLVSP